MPIFDCEYQDTHNDIIGYFDQDELVAFSIVRKYDHNNVEAIQFSPQGIVMTFYGVIGMLLSLFLLVNIIFNVGGGYNKYDKNIGKVEIFRLGFPLQIKEIYLSYSFKDVRSIKLSIQEGLNPKREIYLCTKDQREIPLTRVGEPLLLSSIEEEAVDLSLFLNVPLED
jgi:hypothetical protein